MKEIKRIAVRSERRIYEGPLTGHDADKVLYLSRAPHGDTMIGFKQEAYEELGCPEEIEITVTAK